MASIASATTTSRIIDSSKSGKYPIFLGDELLYDRKESRRSQVSHPNQHLLIDFDHLPIVTSESETASLSQCNATGLSNESSEAIGYYNLTPDMAKGNTQGASKAWKYSIVSSAKLNTAVVPLVLIFHDDKQSFELTKLSTKHTFKQLSHKFDGHEALQDDRIQSIALSNDVSLDTHPTSNSSTDKSPAESPVSDDEMDSDDSNPYDYRHFLTEAEGTLLGSASVSARTPSISPVKAPSTDRIPSSAVKQRVPLQAAHRRTPSASSGKVRTSKVPRQKVSPPQSSNSNIQSNGILEIDMGDAPAKQTSSSSSSATRKQARPISLQSSALATAHSASTPASPTFDNPIGGQVSEREPENLHTNDGDAELEAALEEALAEDTWGTTAAQDLHAVKENVESEESEEE